MIILVKLELDLKVWIYGSYKLLLQACILVKLAQSTICTVYNMNSDFKYRIN